ncbi:MAG: hemerythrin domain-containing protein [Frankia sp.]|nr:hemerythrin domain-containing protein [Frankia sp.]
MLTLDDLLPIRLLHTAMRVEYGRLAAAARAPRGAAHAAVIEEHIDLTLHVLHHHHTGEDTHFWPVLRERAPECAAAVDRLEAQHSLIEPLLAAASDRKVALAERADALAELHTLINAHLDEEEATLFPLLLEHYTKAELEAIDETMRQTFGRKMVPQILCWMLSALDPEVRASSLATLPLIPRTLLTRVWEPSYRRRFVRIYGPDVQYGALPQPTQTKPGMSLAA